MIYIIISGILSFLIAAFIGPYVIKFMIKLKFGQSILDIGPSWHKKKQGTPTMGGFIFIIPVSLCTIAFSLLSGNKDMRVFLLIAVSICYAFIGFIDDYIKVVKKRNLGLTAKQKAFLQLLVSVAFIVSLKLCDFTTTTVYIPFFNARIELSVFYYIIMLLLIVFSVNSVNLTDGVDGLASSVTLPVAVLFIVIGAKTSNTALSIASAALLGGLVGFLIYNHNPAKVFMGDTGSMFLGGMVTGFAFVIDMPVILLLYGFVYLFEALSVVLQVISFKTTGKRIFKMSPIHHHFEMCGWSEKKIVAVFTLVAAAGAALAYIGIINTFI